MTINRLFAIVAVIGLIAAAAFTVRASVRTSAVVASPVTEHENIAERSSEFLNRQTAAGNSITAAKSSEAVAKRALTLQDIAERSRILQNVRSLELQNELSQVRAATAQFHRTDAAKAAGYTLANGLDSCFDNPADGEMEFHLIKTSSLDLTLSALEPEALVYQPALDGQLQLVAVEYIVPAAAWRAAGNRYPPAVLGQSFHMNYVLDVYVLHAWIWQENPSGMFQDWNPKVSCV